MATPSTALVVAKILRQSNSSSTIDFYYEGSALLGFKTAGANYYYLFNLQGDVIGIINSSGTQVVSYTYDAYGKVLTTTGSLASTIGVLNPFRYRGYYLDSETGLYYLNDRYYDPSVGRFLNADGRISGIGGNIRGYNLFSYCMDNPVNMVDHNGDKPGDLFDTMDEAARDAAVYLGSLSFDTGWEYATSIYSKTVTEVHKGWLEEVNYFINFSFSKGFYFDYWVSYIPFTYYVKVTKYTYKTVKTDKEPMQVAPQVRNSTLAVVHTHPMGSGQGITRFSSADIEFANRRNLILYVHGPNGELRKYDPTTGEDILIFDDLPPSVKTPWLE